jgi:hypothetical protein
MAEPDDKTSQLSTVTNSDYLMIVLASSKTVLEDA